MQTFVSHSFEDKRQFDDLCHAMDQAGLQYWHPSSMTGGLPLRDQLRQAIAECDACLFLATRRSISSSWCQAEIGAFWGSGKRVIIYVADDQLDQASIPVQFQADLRHNTLREVVRDVQDALNAATTAALRRLEEVGVVLQSREQRPVLDMYPPSHYRSLFMAGPTLMHSTYRRQFFSEMVLSGCTLQLLVPNPDQATPAVLGLRGHWHHGTEHFEDFLDEIRKSLKGLQILQESIPSNALGSLRVAYLDCCMTNSLLLSNQDGDDAELQIELLPFNTDATCRPHFVLRPTAQRKWFSRYKTMCNDMWKRAVPLDLASFDIDALRHGAPAPQRT